MHKKEHMITIGSDIGGTFTDFASVNQDTNLIQIHKRLTTPRDPSEAIEVGIREIVAAQNLTVPDIAILMHGTTLVINSIIERKGAKTGLITTKGFRDVLEIGREKRYDAYDLKISFPKPLISRKYRLEVNERIHASGEVLSPLDETSVVEAWTRLKELGCESVAICLLHAYKNPMHEMAVAKIIRKLQPNIHISLSSEILPQMREYERTYTTVVNAYTQPIVDRYLNKIKHRLEEQSFSGEILIMQSNAGLTTIEKARKNPVQIIESGPAAGALAAAYFGSRAGIENLLAFDMGGTTAKMVLIENGEPIRANSLEVAHVHRFKDGSGIPVHVPVIDLIEIGAGGGSVARITDVQTIQVGPDSQSAFPGPACYGQGGDRPTVTDADLILGYLNPDNFLGGTMALDVEAAATAITDKIAEPLNIKNPDAAIGIYTIVNENMAAAAKAYLTRHGRSIKDLALVATGGAGPLHGCDLAIRLGIKKVVIPPNAGVAGAFGMILAPFKYETMLSEKIDLSSLSNLKLNNIISILKKRCISGLAQKIERSNIEFRLSIDMRYVGQGFDLEIDIPQHELIEEPKIRLRELFENRYRHQFSQIFEKIDVEALNFRMAAISDRNVDCSYRDLKAGRDNIRQLEKANGPNDVYRESMNLQTRKFERTPVFQRQLLYAGMRLKGPCIIEENESTTIVPYGAMVEIHDSGSLLINLGISN